MVQEGLTNSAKHAPGARVDVLIESDDRTIAVDIVTAPAPIAAGSSPQAALPGHGLVGLEERVALYEGCLRTEPSRDGGFRLAARMSVT